MGSAKNRWMARASRLIISAVLVVTMIWLLHGSNKQPIETYSKDIHRSTGLLWDILESDRMPTPERTIFFHETKCNNPDAGFQVMNLTARQACAIESAALHNPNFDVFVLFTCPSYRALRGVERSLIDAIKTYEHVHLRQLNQSTYAAGTPVGDWIKKGDLLKSYFPMQHTSDLLRLLSVYRFGGIYMDMDVVVLRSLENVPLNFIGTENNLQLGSAVIGLEQSGKGHEIAELFLQGYQQNYNANGYTSNGPELVTRVVRKICGMGHIEAMKAGRKACQGLQIFNSTAFYAIPWPSWKHFTEPQYLEDTMEKTKDSYLVHLWNKLSFEVHIGSNTAYGKYMQENCPRTYAAAVKYIK